MIIITEITRVDDETGVGTPNQLHLAANIRKVVKIPVIAVCNVKHPAFAEQMLEEGAVDFVGIARGHLADPEWGKKASAGNDILIRKCLGCMECFRILNDGLPLGCTAPKNLCGTVRAERQQSSAADRPAWKRPCAKRTATNSSVY